MNMGAIRALIVKWRARSLTELAGYRDAVCADELEAALSQETPAPCVNVAHISRICERGTFGCNITHGKQGIPAPRWRQAELAEYIAVSLHQPEKAKHIELILKGWPLYSPPDGAR